MKLVIQTQYRENYAAHNEDYVHGVSEAYWKFKGGETFVVSCSFADAAEPAFRQAAFDAVSYSNEASEEYVLDWEIVDDAEFLMSNHIEEWDTPTMLWFDGEHFMATKKTDNTHMGYMRSEILTKFESWTITPEDSRSDYKSTFTMDDGSELTYAELGSYFAEAA
tara:strand:- start:3143 stop:3637 length:495 start_codon:yes stop_codon:yes gene_type:complete